MISKGSSSNEVSELLLQSLAYITPVSIDLPILDLACGLGRNGLYLLEQGHDVVFADKNLECLASIKQKVSSETHFDQSEDYDEEQDEKSLTESAHFWRVDFERDGFNQLASKQFAAIVVFRYLHRALFTQIKQAVVPGGLVVYETFTQEQAKFGRPKNPDFLLAPGELKAEFSDWTVLHYFEGEVLANDHAGSEGNKQAIAQIIAIKPE